MQERLADGVKVFGRGPSAHERGERRRQLPRRIPVMRELCRPGGVGSPPTGCAANVSASLRCRLRRSTGNRSE